MNWMGIVHITWPFADPTTATGANKKAAAQFEEMVLKHLPEEVKAKIKVKAKAAAVKTREKGIIRLGGPYYPGFILANRVKNNKRLPPEVEFRWFVGDGGGPYRASMASTRYDVFAKDDCTCQACGLIATEMFLERSRGTTDEGRGHFNLYAIEDGKEVLFTQDHILPASKGGTDSLANLQTFCAICNRLKGRHQITNAQVKELRDLFNKHRGDSPALLSAIKDSRLGIGSDGRFGKNKLRFASQCEAKKLAEHSYLRLKNTLVAIRSGDEQGSCHVYELEKLAEKTREKMEETGAFFIEAGTILKVCKAKRTNVVCFYHPATEDQPVKLAIHYQLLGEPDEIAETDGCRETCGSGSSVGFE